MTDGIGGISHKMTDDNTFVDGVYFDKSLTKTIELFRCSCTVHILCNIQVQKVPERGYIIQLAIT